MNELTQDIRRIRRSVEKYNGQTGQSEWVQSQLYFLSLYLVTFLGVLNWVSVIFDGQRFQRIATTPTFSQEYQRTVRGRILYLGLVYSFGSGKKDKQPSFEYDQS